MNIYTLFAFQRPEIFSSNKLHAAICYVPFLYKQTVQLEP